MSAVGDVMIWMAIIMAILVVSCGLMCCVRYVMRRPGGCLERARVHVQPHSVHIVT